MEKRDEDLIRDVSKGNEAAFNELFERYKRPILNFSLRILGNRADAEDVTAEFFMTLFSKSQAYQPKAKFSTWAFTVARNACISKIRKRRRMIPLWFTHNETGEVEAWDIPDPDSLTPQELSDQEIAQLVRKAILNLPQAQREALVLREYHHLSYAQIAQTRGCSLENVKILIYRARERLKCELSAVIMENNND